ncbi:MAG: UvrB/UvrC motif-containing protein [Clostridia bacterium]|nr:UvrB/UvrC motif-containing protein [Clostridia bacterium]
MICNKCGKNNAEIYYKHTVNGQTKEYALCSKCAEQLQKEGKLNVKIPSLFDDFDFGFGSSKFFGLNDLFGLTYDNNKSKIAEKKKCTLCASTFDDLVKRGKVGCAKCYEIFADELNTSVESIHGKAKYMGKKPKKYKEKETKEDKIKDLKAQMNAAIEAQEFEKAAVIRDEIRTLENDN